MDFDADRRSLMKTAGVVSVGVGIGGVGSAEAQESLADGPTVYVGSEDETLYAVNVETDEQG